jgi:hypothetical protein
VKWSIIPSGVAVIDLAVLFSLLKWAAPLNDQVKTEDDPQKQALHALIVTIYIASIIILPLALVAVPAGWAIASGYRKKAEKEKNKSPWQESHFHEKQQLVKRLAKVEAILEYIDKLAKSPVVKATITSSGSIGAKKTAACKFDFGRGKKQQSIPKDAFHDASTEQTDTISLLDGQAAPATNSPS